VSSKLLVMLAFCAAAQGLCLAPALAAPPDGARQTEARKECLAGRYQHGIDILAELYAETRDANYIYNQGRCFQQNNRPDEAISRFQEYLRKAPDLTPEELGDVRGKIAECERMRGEPRRPEPVPPPAPPPAASPTPLVVSTVPAAAPADHGRALRVVGMVGMAVGLAGVGTGAAFGLQARGIKKDIEDRYNNDDRTYSRQTAASGERAVLRERLSFAIGGAVLLAGALTYYLGVPPHPESQAITFTPMFARAGAGGTVHVRF
jgi:tetratricopeptide (TPR) repeat protein